MRVPPRSAHTLTRLRIRGRLGSVTAANRRRASDDELLALPSLYISLCFLHCTVQPRQLRCCNSQPACTGAAKKVACALSNANVGSPHARTLHARQAQQQQQDPLIQMQQQELQIRQQEVQIKQQEVQIKGQKAQSDAQIAQAKLQIEQQKVNNAKEIDAMKVGIDSAKHQAQLAQQAKQASMNTLTDIGKHKAELEMQKRQTMLQHIQSFKRDEKPPKEPKA